MSDQSGLTDVPIWMFFVSAILGGLAVAFLVGYVWPYKGYQLNAGVLAFILASTTEGVVWFLLREREPRK